MNVTSVFVCGEDTADDPSCLLRSIIDRADCVIALDRFEYRGTTRVLMRVNKTLGMRHRRDSFELMRRGRSRARLKIRPLSLLRVEDGTVRPVKVRLLFHAETAMQKRYNEAFRNVMTAVVSRETELESPDVGARVIRLLTRPEGESDRLRLGVGMPTREAFYRAAAKSDGAGGTARSRISPFFDIDAVELADLISHRFRRSTFRCYSLFSRITTYHLQRIIEIPTDLKDAEVDRRIRELFNHLRQRTEFVRQAGD